jgi:hypothetical protein
MDTHQTKATRRTLLTLMAVGHILGTAAHAADTVGPEASRADSAAVAAVLHEESSAAGDDETVCRPTISTKMMAKNRHKISDAFELALDRVREVPECRGLFEGLGADWKESLGRIVFLPIGRAQGRGDVCRGKSAYTMVGGGPVRVCREFSRLSDTQAAMVIIHEALHHAGLTEYPLDPDGMTSNAINGMVAESCGL